MGKSSMGQNCAEKSEVTVSQTGPLLDSAQPTVAEAALKFWQQAEKVHWHPVQGISMWPFLKPGDKVLVSPEVARLTIGDVVLVRFDQRLLVHRVAEINQGAANQGTVNDGTVNQGAASQSDQIVTWGDFNLRPDSTAERSQVVGKVIQIERNHRQFPIGPLRERWGKAILSARPLLVPFIFAVRTLARIKSRLKM